MFKKRIIVISESTFEKGLTVQDHIQNKYGVSILVFNVLKTYYRCGQFISLVKRPVRETYIIEVKLTKQNFLAF